MKFMKIIVLYYQTKRANYYNLVHAQLTLTLVNTVLFNSPVLPPQPL